MASPKTASYGKARLDAYPIRKQSAMGIFEIGGQVVTRLLLIDDDPDDCLIIQALLESIQGVRYEITVEHNAFNGSSLIEEYDVALIDVLLGVGSVEETYGGVELARSAQARKITTPILLVTGHVDLNVPLPTGSTLAATAAVLGVKDVLSKQHLTASYLHRRIQAAMGNAPSGQFPPAQKPLLAQASYGRHEMLLAEQNRQTLALTREVVSAVHEASASSARLSQEMQAEMQKMTTKLVAASSLDAEVVRQLVVENEQQHENVVRSIREIDKHYALRILEWIKLNQDVSWKIILYGIGAVAAVALIVVLVVNSINTAAVNSLKNAAENAPSETP
jgi:CheY-like chemotaxis protein